MTWVWRVLIGLLLAITGAVAGAYLWLRADLPDYDEALRVEGLEAPVQIMRDANAVPHIFAANEGDAYFALGYVHAQDRLWQMEFQRRVGAGRLAELRFFGARALPADRLFRTLGAYRDAEASYRTLAPDVRAALDAYAAGVNAWIAANGDALPPEFALVDVEPEPWRPADSLVWGRLIAFQLSANYRGELLRAQLAGRLAPEQVDDLFPDGTGAPPPTLADAAAAIDRLRAALPPPLGPATASNEWVLSGERTATGRPLLVNDPHLGLAAPVLWYLARIRTPTLTLAGATVPGVPFIVLGHNGTIAWGFTTTGGDVQDLFVERVDPADPDRYITPDGSAPFAARDELIQVYGSDPVRLRVRETRHGPVLSDISPDAAAAAGDGHVLALAYTAVTPRDIGTEAIYRLNHAVDWDTFRLAMRAWRAPQQNVVYADVAGNIGFFTPGDVPIRRAGEGLYPVPGWSGEHDWTGRIPFDELPQALNPDSGRFVNANNAVVGPDYPHLIAKEYDDRYRAARIAQMLDGGEPQTAETAEAMLMDAVSPAAADLLPVMLTVRADDARTAETLAALRRWDYAMDRNAREPLLFVAWLRALQRALYADELGPLADDYVGFRPAAVKRMLTERPAWCDNVDTQDVESCPDILRSALGDALDLLARRYGDDPAEWRWGAAHVAPLAHPLFSRVPVVDRLIDLSIDTDGGQFTVNRGAMALSDEVNPFAHVHGAGYRAVYDLADLDNSRFIIATGQSGHPLSPFYGNLVIPWRDGEHVRLSGSPEELAETGIGTLSLRPAE